MICSFLCHDVFSVFFWRYGILFYIMTYFFLCHNVLLYIMTYFIYLSTSRGQHACRKKGRQPNFLLGNMFFDTCWANIVKYIENTNYNVIRCTYTCIYMCGSMVFMVNTLEEAKHSTVAPQNRKQLYIRLVDPLSCKIRLPKCTWILFHIGATAQQSLSE